MSSLTPMKSKLSSRTSKKSHMGSTPSMDSTMGSTYKLESKENLLSKKLINSVKKQSFKSLKPLSPEICQRILFNLSSK